MELTNSKSSFGWVSIIIHWISALAVIGLFALGWWMVDLTYYSEWYQTAPLWHVSIGILLAAVTVVRLIWRFSQPVPINEGANWEKVAAQLAHGLLYLLLFLLFVTGYLIPTADGRGIEVFDWFALPSMGELFEHQETISGDIHRWAAYIIIGLSLFHGLAAFKHHLIDKDSTLRRMLKPANNHGDTQ
ncbi:cytochrome b [Neptunicella sp. SCSIO 80796]|uniref:cytochrome b n=1 Tax=Neptunicella plasticusilytica TaxID=3117012 RepID=UPI003A4D4D9F